MKNIYSYNVFESKKPKSFVKEIDDFCKVNLAYLIDDGINIELGKEGKILIITLENDYNDIQWDKIKYDFLPFLEITNDKYKVLQVLFGKTDKTNKSFTIDKIMRDDFNIKNIEYIQLFIKDKKI